MPLSTLLDLCGKQDQADQLLHSSLHLVCLGLRGKPNMSEITGCIYYPEVGTIFHKACVFSQVDSDSVPDKENSVMKPPKVPKHSASWNATNLTKGILQARKINRSRLSRGNI